MLVMKMSKLCLAADAALVAVVGCLFCCSQIQASTLTYDFGDVVSGSPPASAPPWASAQFQDASDGTVLLSISTAGLSSSENAGWFLFNLNPTLNPSNLRFNLVGQTGSFDAPRILTGLNTRKAAGAGSFDIEFDFSNGPTDANRFTAGEQAVFDISGIAGLSASSFHFTSLQANGTTGYYAAAHIQRIAASPNSGWIAAGELAAVPEPATWQFFALAIATCGALRVRPRKTRTF